jgi:magnesium-transporting ATPase (P-type)
LNKHKTNNKEINTRLGIKSAIIVSILILINFTWYSIFRYDNLLSINLGVISPIIYGVFYFLVKKSRRKYKSKIKSFIYIPILYTLLGLLWLGLSIGLEKFTKTENIESQTVIEKLEFKHFFLFNHNLAFPSRIINEIELKSWKQSSDSQEILKTKMQTNNMILYVMLFAIQCIIIFSVENYIYPKFRPAHKKKNKRRLRKAPRDTFISKEEDLYYNFGRDYSKSENELKSNSKENQFPEL